MARMAIPMLQAAGLHVGDQLPYSGKLLNATMNRHAEGNGIPYLGIEMRQDLVSDEAGQRKFAGVLATILRECQVGRDTSELQSLMRISYAVFFLKKQILYFIS